MTTMNDAKPPLRSTPRTAFLAQLETICRARPQLEARTGTCLLDWVDALHLGTEPGRRRS